MLKVVWAFWKEMPFENSAASLVFMGPSEMHPPRQSWPREVSRQGCVPVRLSYCTAVFGQSVEWFRVVSQAGQPALLSFLNMPIWF